jgi:hypothetical protein
MRHRANTRTALRQTPGQVSGLLAAEEARALVSPRAIPPVHRYRRHPSSPGRGRDRSCDDDKESYPHDDRGTETCSDGRDREGGRDGDRWLVGRRARSFPGLRDVCWRSGRYWATEDPQEVDRDPRGSLQNVDSLLQAGRIPCFRLLSRRRWVGRGLGPLAQQCERHDPGDLGSRDALSVGTR